MTIQDQSTFESAAREVFKSLQQIPISAVIKHRRRTLGMSPLVAVHEETPLSEVLKILRESNILAVPVFTHPEIEPSGRVYRGIVSVYDILAWTVFQKMFDNMEEIRSEEDNTFEFNKYMENVAAQQSYFATPVKELIGGTKESQETWTLHSHDPLSNYLQMVTSAGYHRVLVIDDDALVASASQPDDGFGPTAPPSGSSIVMLTQTDVLLFLWDARKGAQDIPLDSLKHIFDASVHDVNELSTQRRGDTDPNQPVSSSRKQRRAVITAPDTYSAIAAFRLMYIHRLSAIAIIDPKGGMVCNLSASDLRGLTMSTLENLENNVFDFLEREKRTPEQIKADQLRVVRPNSSLGDAIEKMLTSHVHRVWIVGADDKPVGCVTMTDALTTFIPESL